ncbi:hypothetical protein FRC06_009668, partial [Ceratobasidium sp. 370]
MVLCPSPHAKLPLKVSRLSPLASRLLPLVSRLPSPASRLPPLVSRLLSPASCLPPLVSRLSSLVSRLSPLASRLALYGPTDPTARRQGGMPGKNYDARAVLRLDISEYRLLLSDITELAIVSGLNMEKPFRMQNMAQLLEVRQRALELYPGLGIFDSYEWPFNTLLRLVLKASLGKASLSLYKARKAERKQVALWAKLLMVSLSRVVPPPAFPVVFDLASLPYCFAGFLLEALLGIPLALWPVVSLATISWISAILPSPLVPICAPRFTLLLPSRFAQSRIVTVNIAPPNCPFLTRKYWTLRMSIQMVIEGEVTVQGREAGASESCLAIVRAVPVWCELIDQFTDGGSTDL